MKLKFYIYTFLALILTGIILAFPSECLALALNGLNLWFERMIPTLFPFMVLSGIMIRMNMTGSFTRLLAPILGRLFKVNASCLYGIVIGFLCGFPMGAHVAAQMYQKKQITREEASFLLSFCNNIGPVYFLSFVLPTLHINKPLPFLAAMYGIPFLYGLFLRYTYYKSKIRYVPGKYAVSSPETSLLKALDESIFSALSSIAKLGGYMIFFNLLFILPILITGNAAGIGTGCIGCLLEITGGIGLLKARAPLWVLCILPLGGLSCIAQTYSMIKETNLSITEYVMHKAILTAITVFYYLLPAAISS